MAEHHYHVRPAQEGDLPALRAADTRPESHLIDEVFAGQHSGDAVFAVAHDGDDVIGAGVLDLRPGDLQPEVKYLWVPRERRRQGVGAAVAAYLEDVARDKGFDACFMAIDPDNEQAIPLAIDLGYSATGDHKFVEAPFFGELETHQEISEYYAVYRKSLTMR